MELRQLTYFLEVAKTGKVSVAADNLYVTQPTVTTSIKNLEQELNAKLFDRNHDGLILTEAGKVFHPHAVKILGEVEKAKENMALLQPGMIKPLEISIPAISGGMIYPLIYNQFKKDFPGINIVINDTFSHESIRRVVEDEHEIGFCIYNNEYADKLNFLEFAQGEIMILIQANGKFAEYDAIPLKELIDELWLLNRRTNSNQTATELIVLENIKNKQLEIPKIKYIEDHHTIITTVAMGVGIYPYPNTSHRNPFVDYPGVASKRIEDGIFYKVGLIYKKGKRLSKSAEQFIAWYKDIMKGLGRTE